LTDIQSEEKLIAAAQKGDKKAISQLVNKYSPRIYAIAFRLMQNEEDAKIYYRKPLLL
jgi:DNA-directed RNA polymerase specialized sigma24 family protein